MSNFRQPITRYGYNLPEAKQLPYVSILIPNYKRAISHCQRQFDFYSPLLKKM